MTEKIITACPVCGLDVINERKRGRPKEYHPECKRLEGLFSWAESIIPSLKITEKKMQQVRGRCFTLANLFNDAGNIVDVSPKG